MKKKTLPSQWRTSYKQLLIRLLGIAVFGGINFLGLNYYWDLGETSAYAQSPGTDYYVAVTGSDAAGSGTQAKPWGTLKFALGRLQAGDKLYIGTGTYKVNDPDGLITLSKSGTATKPITVTTYNGRVVIDGEFDTARFLLVTGDFWVLDGGAYGLEIARFYERAVGIVGNYNILRNLDVHDMLHIPGKTSDTVVAIRITAKEYGGVAHHNILENNKIYNVPDGEAIYLGSHMEGVALSDIKRVENNIIRHNVIYNVLDGIDGKSNAKNNLILGNTIYDCGIIGIDTVDGDIVVGNVVHSCRGDSTTPHGILVGRDAIVVNNLIYNNEVGIAIKSKTTPALGSGTSGYDDNRGDRNKIINNTIADNDAGIKFLFDKDTSELQDNVVQNNIIAFNTDYQVANGTLNGNNIFAKNLMYGVGNVRGTQVITTNPLFVDKTSHNYRVQVNSPGINGGIEVPFFDITQLQARGVDTQFLNLASLNRTDIEGVLRPQGAKFDIGAYEYGASVTLTPTPSPTPSPVVTACPGDYVVDGQVDAEDLLYVLSHWGKPDGQRGIFKGEKLLLVLTQWGKQCG